MKSMLWGLPVALWLAATPDLIVPSLRPYRSRGELSSWVCDDSVAAFLDERLRNSRYAALGEFKVPSLRNLAATAPYMHNGSRRTLREVLRHYCELDEDRLHADGESILVPLRLTPGETEDLLAFLDSLNAAEAPSTPQPSR